MKDKIYQDCLAITAGLVAAHLIFKEEFLVYAALGIGLGSLLSTYLASNISFVWNKIAFLLGLIIPQVLLTLIFYLFLTPLGLLSKVFKKVSFQLKPTKDSQYTDQNRAFQKEDFERSW